jgi:ferredoxin
MTVWIASSCTACGACVITCPEDALTPSPLRPRLDARRCTDCLECLEVCPAGAVGRSVVTKEPS